MPILIQNSSPQQPSPFREQSLSFPHRKDCSSSYHHDEDANEDDDEDDADVQVELEDELDHVDQDAQYASGNSPNHPQPLANGDHPDSDSDDQSNVVRRRRRSQQKFVIPEDMRDDTRYFRRSSRSRHAPERLLIPHQTLPAPLASAVTLTTRLTMLTKEEDEDEEYKDLDDDDFTLESGRRFEASDADDRVDDGNASPSHSEDDWLMDGTPAKLAGKRRRRFSQHPKKRRRTNSVPVDDEAFRSARINSRTGGTVNYFEGDDLSEEEAAILAAKQAEEAADANILGVDQVLDYRVMDGKPKAGEGDGPYTDFAVSNVEFKVKWTITSFRKCTWETWDTLQAVKGAKKVRNFVKSVEEVRKHVWTHATPEDIEDLPVNREENRELFRSYEVVDRIIAQRETEDLGTEYLVKWCILSYEDCTWEKRSDLSTEVDMKAIDAFSDREQAVLSMTSKKRFNPFNVKDDRPKMSA
ncbi:chromo (chromatin organization modifier) [Gracilaria domingensis]|nr:chromo (chromatin organization modifier) [Gracilaria domingensis]